MKIKRKSLIEDRKMDVLFISPILLAAFFISIIFQENISFAEHNNIFDNAVAVWHMDEINTGDRIDAKGKYVFSNLGMDDGYFQKAVYFNGTNSFLQTPLTFNNWQSVTVSLWVKPEHDLKKDISIIFDVGHTEKERCAFQLDNISRSAAWLYAGANIIVELKHSVWSHIVLVADGNEKKIKAYCNGIKVGEADVLPTPNFDDTPFTLGKLAKADDRYFKGAIDEVVVWNRPLDERDVKTLYLCYKERAGVPQEVIKTSETVEILKQSVGVMSKEIEVLKNTVVILEQKIDGISAKIDSITRKIDELKKLHDLSTITHSLTKNGSKPNIIMIVSDTLRADHVSAINSTVEYETKNIDRLAQMGVLFSNAISQAPFTFSSMGSIFTGMYPSVHKAYSGLLPNHRGRYNEQIQIGVMGFTDILRENGYGIYTITQNYNPTEHGILMTPIFQVKAHNYDINGKPIANYDISGKPLVAINHTIDFLKSATHPYFLYVHIIDPHDVYDNALDIDPSLPRRLSGPANSYAATVNDLNLEHKKYCLEIQGVDKELGRLIDYLVSIDYFKDNALIFLSDHGEYFNERPEFHSDIRPINKLFPYPHGFDLHQEQIHVPLAIITPAVPRKGLVVTQFVETRALFPTILEIADLKCINSRIYPKSLLPLTKNGGKGEYCISEGVLHITEDTRLNTEPFNIEYKSIISPEGLKLIHNTLHKSDIVYDLNKDPGELHPLDHTTRETEILALKHTLADRIDINADFIKPEPYETILSMPQNCLISGINATNSDKDHSLIYIFDNDLQTFWQNDQNIPLPVSLTFVLKKPCSIKQLRLTPRQDNPQWFKNARLLASNDGYTWDTLADIAVTDYSKEEKPWEFSINKTYCYYKLDILEITDVQQNTVSIAELRLIIKDSNR